MILNENTDCVSYLLIRIILIGMTFTRIDLDLPMVTWTYCAEMEIVVISYTLSKKKKKSVQKSSVFVIFSLSSEDGFDLWGLLKQPRAGAAS